MMRFSITVRWDGEDPYYPDVYELVGSRADSERIEALLTGLVDEGVVDSYGIEALPASHLKVADLERQINEQASMKR
jgi:hypothetical protein